MSRAPEGTKAWRKSWRKKWREGSSFRDLSLAAKAIVGWVEDNCNDDGQVTTTVRHLAKMISGKHHKQKVPTMTTWRALREATQSGLLVTEAVQQAVQGAVQAPTLITRVNYKEYQEKAESSGTGSGTALEVQAVLSSRGMQKKLLPTEEADKPAKQSPLPPALFLTLSSYGLTPDKADKGLMARLVTSGTSPADVTARAVVGVKVLGAHTVRGALSAAWAHRYSDPHTALELADVHERFARFTAKSPGPGKRAEGGARDPATQSPAGRGLPEVGAVDEAERGAVRGAGGQAGPVQDDLGLDDGRQPGAGGETSLLDWLGDAPRADGPDVGLAAHGHSPQEAGGCLETGGFLDLR